jgi:hypothetical protein
MLTYADGIPAIVVITIVGVHKIVPERLVDGSFLAQYFKKTRTYYDECDERSLV